MGQRRSPQDSGIGKRSSAHAEAAAGAHRFEADMEELPTGAEIGVDILGLRKEWRLAHLGGVKVALDNLNLQFLKNNVNVLLGQNGAGKTTALSIVTGMYAPTAGTALVNG